MTETNIDDNIIIEEGPNDNDNGDLPKKHRVDTGATTQVGAVKVDEPAPQLNRRFYRGLDRLSVRIRNARRREERRRQIQRQNPIILMLMGTGMCMGRRNRMYHKLLEEVLRLRV